MLGIAVIVLAGFWIENKATGCGAGLVDADFPHDLRVDWFNGGFWLTDREGWGVVAPPGEVKLSDGTTVGVERIERYTQEHGFVVEVALPSGQRALMSFEGATGSTLRPRLLESGQLDDPLRNRSSWTEVDPGSCFYGRFGVARAVTVMSILLLIAVGLRKGLARGAV